MTFSSTFRLAAQRVRHHPVLENAETFWALLRRPYQYVLSLGGRGTEISVGGITIRIPPEYAGASWETFEPESVRQFSQWVARNPGGLVFDIGCSLGIYSALALSVDPTAKVIAIDGDIASLAAAKRLCQHAAGRDLVLVHGLVTNEAPPTSLDDAARHTHIANVSGDVGTTRFVCLTGDGADMIPKLSVDNLFPTDSARPVLLKCDVEGAELLVLIGAERLLRRTMPSLLISVHPPALPEYGHSVEDVRRFLERLNYSIDVIAIDHEEHWWCEPRCR